MRPRVVSAQRVDAVWRGPLIVSFVMRQFWISADIELGLRRAVELMNPLERAQVVAALAHPGEDLAVEIDLVDVAVGVGGEQVFVRRGCDADRRRCAKPLPLCLEVQIAIEDLDAAVRAIADVDVPCASEGWCAGC